MPDQHAVSRAAIPFGQQLTFALPAREPPAAKQTLESQPRLSVDYGITVQPVGNHRRADVARPGKVGDRPGPGLHITGFRRAERREFGVRQQEARGHPVAVHLDRIRWIARAPPRARGATDERVRVAT